MLKLKETFSRRFVQGLFARFGQTPVVCHDISESKKNQRKHYENVVLHIDLHDYYYVSKFFGDGQEMMFDQYFGIVEVETQDGCDIHPQGFVLNTLHIDIARNQQYFDVVLKDKTDQLTFSTDSLELSIDGVVYVY